MKKTILILAGILLFFLIGCVKNLTPDQILELNRHGNWQQAVRASQKIIENRDDFPFGQVCQVYHSLIYAKTRLKQQKEAGDSFYHFREYKANRPFPTHLLWLNREVEKLRQELGITDTLDITPVLDDSWETADPGNRGMNVQALDEFIELCKTTGADACLVVYESGIAAEWYAETPGKPLAGPTLSLTGILMGILIDQGRIANIDEPVATYLPEWSKGDRSKVTLHQLLTMTSGLVDEKNGRALVDVQDKNMYVTGLRPVKEPGTTWEYSSSGVQLLSPVMNKAAGMPIQAFARKYLFKPLDMNSTWFNEDMAGNACTYSSLFTTPRDLAKIGLLLLNNGSYQGKQIVSPGWIAKMTSPSQDLNPSFYLLWRKFFIPPGVGDIGAYNSLLAVYPDKKLIVIRIQSQPAEQESEQNFQRQASQLIDRFIN